MRISLKHDEKKVLTRSLGYDIINELRFERIVRAKAKAKSTEKKVLTSEEKCDTIEKLLHTRCGKRKRSLRTE